MDQLNFVEIGFQVGMYFVPFLFALCFHEFAHGYVAKLCGDNTAERRGRLTLSPFAHADPIGTWILPLTAIVFHTPFMFGWAKPVPVESRNLKHPRQQMFWIALAGPAANIFLALVSTPLLAATLASGQAGGVGEALANLLHNFILVNLFLAVFNLIPVHPLDGAKVIERFLPLPWNMWLDRHQPQLSMILFLGVFFLGGIVALPANWMGRHLVEVAEHMAMHFG